jgi:hypothetical protein
MGPELTPELEKLRSAYPAWVELVEREGKHVPEEHRAKFVQMCREMRRLEVSDDGRTIKNLPGFVTIYAISNANMTALNHAVRVTERAAQQKIATPKEWPE